MASLFTTETPTGVNNSDGTPGITFAVSFMVAVAGTITAVRFFSTTTVSGGYTGAVWEVTADDNPGPGAGTLLGSDVLVGAPDAGTWVNIPLDPVVAVEPGVLYRAGVHSDAGRYVNTPAVFGSPVVNGDLTAPANGSDPVLLGSLAQGVFAINAALTYPATTGNGTNYFADVVFTPDGEASVEPTSITVPVALGAPTVTYPLSAGPDSLSIPVALGAPFLHTTPDSITAAVTLGAPTVIGPAPAAPRAGWSSYAAALRFNADEARREATEPPADCPVCGEGLRMAGDVRYCPAGHYVWPAARPGRTIRA